MNLNNKIKPTVAVLLAAFNGKKYINEQLQSILNQKELDLKIFINIDQSTDGTEDYIKEISKNDNRIILLPTGNQFNSASNNFYHLIREVDFSSFDFVALSDQDDIWKSEKLIRSVGKLYDNKCDGYSSNVTAFWDKKKSILIKKSHNQQHYDHYFESAGPGCTFLLSKKLASDLKNFLITYKTEVNKFPHHDWLIYAFARENNFSWFIDDFSSLLYRQHSENELGVNIGFRAFLKRLKQVLSGEGIKKHFQLSELLGFHLKKNISESSLKRKDSLYFFLNSRNFRRRKRDQFLFKFYWFIAFSLGFREKTLRLNFYSLFNFLVIISCFFIIYLILESDNSKIEINNLLNFKEFVIIISASIAYNLITSKRIASTINVINKTKITFFSWNNFFVQGQVLGYLIPQSGVIYRAIVLKDLYKLKYLNYISIYIFLISIELFIISIIFFISLISFNIFNSSIEYLLFIPLSYILIFIIFTLFCIFYFIEIKKVIKKLPNKLIRRLLLHAEVVYLKFFSNIKYLLLIIFYSLFKIAIGIILYLFVLKLFANSVSLGETMFFFSANQLIEPLKITPQNLGITELLFAFIAMQVSLSMTIGIYTKIVLRIIDMISLLILLFFQKAVQIMLFKKNNILV